MKTVGIFYGSTGGKTKEVVDIVASQLGDAKVFDVADGLAEIDNFENIILASPTYGMGDLQDDWAGCIDELGEVNMDGKVVAIIGVGDAALFGANYVESMMHLYDAVEPNGATVVGLVSTDDYDYEDSLAVVDDKFMGLPIDASFDDDTIASKVEEWLDKVKPEFK